MLSTSEHAELRTLQKKAYGRDGGLTDAEEARLRELVTLASPAAEPIAPVVDVAAPALVPYGEATVVSGADVDADTVAVIVETSAPVDAETDAGTSASAESETSPGLRALLRGHWRLAAVASAALLAIGVGTGWALFGHGDAGISLTADQQERRIELAGDGYDEGTVRAVGQDDSALAWYATKGNGAEACLILDVDDKSTLQCQAFDETETMTLGVSLVDFPEDDDGTGESVSAYMLFSTAGEPMVAIQRWEQQPDMWLDQFSGEERERAKELTDEAQAMNLSIIGYFREQPVWLADRPSGAGMETCLVVDGADGQSACLAMEDAIAQGLSVYTYEEAEDPEDAPVVWGIQVAYTVNQTPYLVITRDPEGVRMSVSEVGEDGTRLQLGGEHGDPIDVFSPSGDAAG